MINILMLLTPKSKVEYAMDDFTVRQLLEKMNYHHYTAVPVLNEEGKYVGTITEGDILWHIKNQCDYNLQKAESESIMSIERHHLVISVHSTEPFETLIQLATSQNFVPVLDDSDIFIGIITRGDIINYCKEQLFNKSAN